MGVDSILGGNFSVQTKDFTKRTTSGATDVNQTQVLSESEKLENFKKEIWKEIDSMSWGSNISVQITNSAFEKMMVDKEFKNKMMNIIREDAHGSHGIIALHADSSGEGQLLVAAALALAGQVNHGFTAGQEGQVLAVVGMGFEYG